MSEWEEKSDVAERVREETLREVRDWLVEEGHAFPELKKLPHLLMVFEKGGRFEVKE